MDLKLLIASVITVHAITCKGASLYFPASGSRLRTSIHVQNVQVPLCAIYTPETQSLWRNSRKLERPDQSGRVQGLSRQSSHGFTKSA